VGVPNGFYPITVLYFGTNYGFQILDGIILRYNFSVIICRASHKQHLISKQKSLSNSVNTTEATNNFKNLFYRTGVLYRSSNTDFERNSNTDRKRHRRTIQTTNNNIVAHLLAEENDTNILEGKHGSNQNTYAPASNTKK
jgi:hypothetical protein